MRKTILTLALLATLTPTMAQTDLGDITLDAQIRTRGEYRNGQGSLRDAGADPAGFINDRVRLGLGWERKSLSMKFSAQHTGVWGDDNQTNNSSKGNIGINEAWAKLKLGSQDKGFIQLGRQILSYDDERLLGGLDWAATGRSFDAARLGFQDEHNTIHGIFAYNQNQENKIGNNYTNLASYKSLEALWYHYTASPVFGGSFLFMNQGVENQTTHQTHCMQTMGVYLNTQVDAFSANLSAYYQFGRNIQDQSVSAYLLSLNAKYKISDNWAIGAGDDYISGGDGTSNKCKTFNVLYGTHHKFYGTMDYFNNSSMPSQGLNDLNANVAYTASSKVNMSGTYHYFALNNGVSILRDGEMKKEKSLGSEIDLQVNWKVQKDITLQCGYSMMLATRAMEAVKGGNHNSWQDWGWVSVNVNPRIFSSKK